MEYITLSIFSAALVMCVALDFSVLWALVFGLALFVCYGLAKGNSCRELARMCGEGAWAARNVLATFVLIGALTATWRASGAVAEIISLASHLISPSAFIASAFALNSAVSFLIGTAFGTSATAGVICMTMGRTVGADPLWCAGAIVAGAYFGDRCSPVSGSALLTAEITGIDIYDHVRAMLRGAIVPFAASLAICAAAGLAGGGSDAVADAGAIFESEFTLSPLCAAPAAVVLALAFARVSVRVTLAASILAAAGAAWYVQGHALAEIARYIVLGYTARDPSLAPMVDGGGLISMFKVGVIVLISSCYAGIFKGTGMLSGIERAVERLAARTSSFCAVAAVAVLSSMISCSQTLTILMTREICAHLEPDPRRAALDIADSAVLLPALVPWSIAGAVPLAAIEAPSSCLLFAVFIYLVPLWRAAVSLADNKTRQG